MLLLIKLLINKYGTCSCRLELSSRAQLVRHEGLIMLEVPGLRLPEPLVVPDWGLGPVGSRSSRHLLHGQSRGSIPSALLLGHGKNIAGPLGPTISLFAVVGTQENGMPQIGVVAPCRRKCAC